MTSVFSWQNSIGLCPASFHIPRPNLPVTPGVSWLPTFAFQSPIMKRTSFLGVSSKRLRLRFLKHHPVTSPSANQKKVHELQPSPWMFFENPSLKATGELHPECCLWRSFPERSFEHEQPILLSWQPEINTVISFTTTQCQYTGFAVGKWAEPNAVW